VTADPGAAARMAAEGLPVVLVSTDATVLGAALASAPDEAGRERWLAVMVGDLEDPAVMAAAQEMAGELWPWAGTGGAMPGESDGPL
jgi:hypothetical protein